MNRRVVIISGAAGGLGRALVCRFSEEGWKVAAGYHRQRPGRGEEGIWPVRMDVTSEAQVREATAAVHEKWGRVDVLVHNAGLAWDQPIWQMTVAAWDRVMAVNLTGAFHSSRAVLPWMKNQQDGHIISVSSYSARHGHRGQANYAAAKAALVGFTQSLAQEMGRHNVRVNAVLPGLMRTRMTEALTESQYRELAGSNSLARAGSPSEVARFVVFLAGTTDISGQVFQLDSRKSRWA